MRTFRGHSGFVQSLAFQPGGSLLASGASDGRVIVWNPITGTPVYETRIDGESIGAVAFSPTGTHLAAGSHEGNLHLFFLTEKLLPHYYWREQGRITGIDFTPNGKTLAWSSYDGWSSNPLDPEGGSAGDREYHPSENGQYFILRISPNGRTIAVAGTGPTIDLHDLNSSGYPIRLTHGDRQGVWSLSFSPDGRTLAAGLAGGVQLWDVDEHRLLQQWKDHDDIVTGVAISPDGSRLLTCSWDRTVRLYEFDLVARRRGPLVGYYDWKIGKLFDVAISPDSTLAVTGGDEGDYVVTWDIE